MWAAAAQSLFIDNQLNFSFKWQPDPQRIFNSTPRFVQLPFQKEVKKMVPAPMVVRADYYARQMAWTCRQEWKLEQAARLPLRLRLGSREQVDWLEGKGR